jgi:hypothetical protein
MKLYARVIISRVYYRYSAGCRRNIFYNDLCVPSTVFVSMKARALRIKGLMVKISSS